MPYKINTAFAKSAPAPNAGNKLYRCDQLTGFALRVTKTGQKAFVLNYRSAGTERRITIGDFPTWSVTAARDRARELRRQIDNGDDPLLERKEKRDAMSVADLFELYAKIKFGDVLTRSDQDRLSMWRKYILPQLGNRKLHALSAGDIAALHRHISQKAPVRANRVLEVLRNALSMAKREGHVAQNVAEGFQRNPEQPRERYLTSNQISALIEAVDEHEMKVSAQAILLILLTGARKTEALQAEWAEFDLDQGVWTRPSHHTKQKKNHRVPLNSAAIKLLKEMDAERADPVFLFPGMRPGTPIQDVKKSWVAIRDAATLKLWERNEDFGDIFAAIQVIDHPTKMADEVEALAQNASLPLNDSLRDVRIHDLRHSFASFLINNQVDLPTVGKLLGHTSAKTTERYAHLFDDTLRAATEKMANTISKAK